MLSTLALRSVPRHTVVFTPVLIGFRRTLAHTATHRNSLTAPSLGEHAVKGVEGVHRNDTARTPPSDPLKKQDGVSTIPQTVHGDWVLFHPVYSGEEAAAAEIIHREPTTIKDKIAYNLVRTLKWSMNFVNRYSEKPIPPNSKMTTEELRKGGYLVGEDVWLGRILFLETTAAVPGMVAATVRHLQSLRLMRRDSGWIHTLLEEAENERMHLMTFLQVRKPGIFMRLLVAGAQGVFYNLFFLSYLLSPKACHRFVGYLEEEAVKTYSTCIKTIEDGHFPEWEDKPAPPIAIDYWRLPADAKMLDVIYAVRADETTHRFVNHSLANLDPKSDVNPFALREPNMFVKGSKPGFEREEADEFVRESRRLLEEGRREQTN